MPETFYGEWDILVTGFESAYSQRFIIAGSTTTDGAYDGLPGVNVSADGEAWTVTMEWNDNAGSGWQPSEVRKAAQYKIDEGLTITLGADDNVPGQGDLDFNDLVLTLTSLDSSVNPPANDPPLDFTITERELRPAVSDTDSKS
jgi:hypothetical protein